MPTSQSVAIDAVRATFARDSICIDGISNRIISLLVRFVPTEWVAKIVSFVQRSIKKSSQMN